MILKLYFFLMSLVQIHGYRGPTFRSSIMEGNKPILRMPSEISVEQIEENSPEERLKNEPLWIEELRENIKQLVDKLGHKRAKPHIKMLVKETEDNNNVLLHVEVSSDGVSDINYKHQMRAAYFAIQKQHNVLIKDIDVDHYGEVYVQYVKRSPYHSPLTEGRNKHTRKQRESSSESDKSDSDAFRGVTEIPMEDK